MEFTSFVERVNSEKEAFLKECDLCGKCVESCQILPYIGLSGKNPTEFQEELLEVLKGNQASPSVYNRTFACLTCSSCLRSCPKGLNPYLMQFIIKSELVARGQKPPASEWLSGTVQSEYSQQDALCNLQLKPSDMRWLTKVPSHPEQTDLVLFLGCYPYQHPDKILASLDILEKLNLSFVALSGGSVCCGFKHWFSGDFKQADVASRELVRSLQAFKPKKVVFWCGTCYYIFKEEIPMITSLPFEVQHLSHLLCDNIAQFEFTHPLNKTITVHDSCNLGHKAGDYTSMRSLLSAIPGVKLVEMPHNRQNAICCGAGAINYYPDVAKQLRKNRLKEAENAGADTMASSCTGCHLLFTLNEEDYPIEVKNYITIFAEALGLHYEDKLKKYLKLQNVDTIMKEAKEYIEKSPITQEQMKSIISRFFNRLWAVK